MQKTHVCITRDSRQPESRFQQKTTFQTRQRPSGDPQLKSNTPMLYPVGPLPAGVEISITFWEVLPGVLPASSDRRPTQCPICPNTHFRPDHRGSLQIIDLFLRHANTRNRFDCSVLRPATAQSQNPRIPAISCHLLPSPAISCHLPEGLLRRPTAEGKPFRSRRIPL